MASPVDSARNATNITTAATSHAINVGSPASGDFLLILVRFTTAPGTTTFTGYNNIIFQDTDASDDTSGIWWRFADGTEGATDTMSTTNSVKLGAIAYKITGAANEAPTTSSANTGTTSANTANSSTWNPPAGTPRDILFITWSAGDGEVGAYTGVPSNYANLGTANSGTGGAAASNCICGSASRQVLAADSEDPGAFTHAAHNAGWTAYTIGIPAPRVSLLLPNANQTISRR